ncbi:hypothetical protein Hamer_G011824 [Homarus americanus]|uniref:Uncharacterized protein n=1 Tax=Homarus americanus TaxID=6706 RepID=A0A8J5JYF5_HOMAM|nr:hypothetical protein Hamer_G011824 [Homarus americanus]
MPQLDIQLQSEFPASSSSPLRGTALPVSTL